MNNVIVMATQVLAAMNIVSHTRPTQSSRVGRDHGQSAEGGVGLSAPITSATS